MKSKILEKIRKRTPLEARLKVAVQAFFLEKHNGTIFMPVDEGGNEWIELDKRRKAAFEEAEPLVKNVIKQLAQWQKDGNLNNLFSLQNVSNNEVAVCNHCGSNNTEPVAYTMCKDCHEGSLQTDC